MSHQAGEEGRPKLSNREKETKKWCKYVKFFRLFEVSLFSSSSLSVENVDEISVILFSSPQSPRIQNEKKNNEN